MTFILTVLGLALGVVAILGTILMIVNLIRRVDRMNEAAERAHRVRSLQWQRELWEWQKQNPGKPFMKAVITDDEQVVVWNGPLPPEGLK